MGIFKIRHFFKNKSHLIGQLQFFALTIFIDDEFLSLV
jgi:hypothetical protein